MRLTYEGRRIEIDCVKNVVLDRTMRLASCNLWREHLGSHPHIRLEVAKDDRRDCVLYAWSVQASPRFNGDLLTLHQAIRRRARFSLDLPDSQGL